MNQVIELAEGAAAQEPNTLISFLPFIAMFAILYFLMIRPQRKRQRERMSLLAALKKGDKIVTIAGIHGVVNKINEDGTVSMEISPGSYIKIEKSSISKEWTAQVNKPVTATPDKK